MSGKKSNLKYLTLAFALAGYTASSAYALEGVSTLSSIAGRPPILKSKLDGKDHSVAIRTDEGKTSLNIGDKIYIDYVVTDLDKDPEGANGTVKTVQFWYKNAAGTFIKVPESSIARGTAPTTANTKHTVTLTLTNEMVNVKQIAAVLQAKTSYGTPTDGLWLNIGDIFSSGNVSTPTEKEPGTEGGPEIGAGGGPGDVVGPGTVGPTNPIQPSSKTKMGIFLASDTERKNNYVLNASLIPKVGDTFTAVVWVDENDNGKIDAGETILTGNYTITWQLTGNNADAGGASTLAAAGVDIGTGASITIGDNSTAAYASYEAGAQGFKLRAVPN